MSGVAVHRVGEIDLSDLAAIGRLRGMDGLPYPLGHTHPHIHHDAGIDQGDLSAFREWTDAYVAAEIWVACRVHHSSTEIPDRRILAHRAGEAGYLASQRGNDDVVEVSSLSALDLGAAIAGAVGLTGPGTRPRIVVPGYVGYFGNGGATDGDDDEVSVRVAVHPSSEPAYPVVADEKVAAIATIQSRWHPPQRWGVDWTKNLIACIQIEADGDYIYTPDFSHAVPLTEQILRERIDGLIAEDIAALRLQRRIGP